MLYTLTNDISNLILSGIRFASGAGPYVISGNAFTLTGGITNSSTVGSMTISNNITLTNTWNIYMASGSGNLTFAGNLSGNGTVTQTGGGGFPETVIFAGNNSGFTGSFTQDNSANNRTAFNTANSGSANAAWSFNRSVNGGIVTSFGVGTISFGSFSGGGWFRNNNAGTTTIRVGDLNTNSTFSGALNDNVGSYILLKAGTGTQTMSGGSSYSGGTIVQAGTLKASGNTRAFGSGTLTVAGTGTADLGGLTMSNTLSMTGGTLTNGMLYSATGNFNLGGGTVAAVLAGLAGVNQTSNTTTLTASNSYTGTTTISRGTLIVSGLLGGGNYAGAIANSNSLIFSNSASQTLSGAISGAGSLTFAGNGTTTLGAANSYSGGTVVNGGKLVANNNTSLGSGAVTVNGGALQLNGTYTALGNAGDGTLTVNGGSVSAGANVQLNDIYLNSGELGGAGKFMATNYAVSSGIISGRVSDGQDASYLPVPANLVKSGSGTVVISGTADYTGATVVNGGTLQLTGTGTLTGSSGVTVNANGTFAMGSGTLSVPVTVQSGGALSTLDGNAGGIARYGSLILSDGTSISLDVFGNAADRIAVDSLMASGNLVVNLNIVSLSVGVTNTLLTWNAGWGASTYTLGSYNPLGVEITSLNLITNANSLAVAVNGYDFSGAGATQTISFPTIPNQIYGIPSLILAAQASSGLVVSYRSSDSNVAVISGNLALIQGAGTTTITAVQQGDSNWVGAFVSQRLIVEQASNVITPFGAISNQTYSNNASMTITTPTASSGLPVAVTVKSGPATISGNSVSLTGAGIVVLAANQNGNANYQKASEVTASFSVGMGSQSISFPAIPSQTYGSGPVALEATASSGLPVSYVSSSSNVSISGASVTILGSGTATIVASQLGNSNWSTAVPVTNTLVIAQASNVITPFGAIPNQTYSNNASMTITTPTASSGLPVVVTVKSGPATISGNSVSLTGAGTVVLAANQNGNANYQQASEVTASFSVAKAENMIPFGSLPACTLGDLPLSLPSKTADGLPITYTSSDTNVAFVTQNPVAEVSSDLGTFVMELLPSNAPSTVSNFLSYSNAYTNSFFQESLPGVMIKAGGYEADPSLTAIATHAPVLGEYSLPNDRGTVAMMTTVGKSGMVSSEWFVNLSNNTSLYDPTNSLGNPPGAVFGRIIGSGMNVADAIGNVPTFDSGVPFHRIPLVGVASNQQSFGITNLITLGVTCIAGPAVIPLGVGTVTITATQEGDSNHEAAPPVTQTLVINRMPQSIGTIPLLTNQSYGSLPFLLPEVISSAGLPCTWAVKDGPAVINGNYLSLTGVGVVTLSAMQSGNKIYSEAPIVNKSFTSLGPISGLKSQSIVFKSLPAKSYGTASFPLFGLVKSGLPIAYFSSSTNVAVISGNMVTITGVGSTQITAYQPGDGVNWNAASPVTQVLVVNGNPQKILFKSIGAKPYGVPAFAPVASVSSGLPITFTSSNTNVAVITNGMILPVGVGNTLITASQSGSASYAAAPSFSQSLTITPGIQRINFASLGTNTYGCASIPLVATSSAGLPVGFSSSNTNVAVIRGNLLEIKGAGSAKITATQPGNSLWGTAKSVTQTLTIAKASQSLTFSIPSNVPFTNGGLIPLTAISSSGLPVVYKSGNSTILTIAGTTCVIMKRGTTTIVASQPGGANYIPAPPVTNTITVQ